MHDQDSDDTPPVDDLELDAAQEAPRQDQNPPLDPAVYLRSLEQKVTALESIVYVASHDFRSPLVNILGFSQELRRGTVQLAEMLGGGPLTGEARDQALTLLKDDMGESLDFIQSSARKLEGMLSGLLRLSRLVRLPLATQAVDMQQLVSNVLKDLKPRLDSLDAEVSLAPLPRCQGSASQLTQVVTAILDNAIKYHEPSRHLTISISASERGQEVLYCFEDNGVGIETQQQPKIFDLFQRLNPELAAGEGLGLTFAQHILARHGGEIWVESERGRGAMFCFMLPAAP